MPLNPATAAMLAVATEESHGYQWTAIDHPGVTLLAMQAAIDAGATRAVAIDIAHDITSVSFEES